MLLLTFWWRYFIDSLFVHVFCKDKRNVNQPVNVQVTFTCALTYLPCELHYMWQCGLRWLTLSRPAISGHEHAGARSADSVMVSMLILNLRCCQFTHTLFGCHYKPICIWSRIYIWAPAIHGRVTKHTNF